MSDYYILKTVVIEDGILTPEHIKKAKESLPVEYTTVDEPSIQVVSNTLANITFKCRNKNRKSHPIIGNPNI